MRAELSTRPDNRLGSDEFWDHAEGELAQALAERGIDYKVAEGEGAFYAPKIDLHMTDSLGRSWQIGTVQLDYNLPERFDLTYTGADNAGAPPGDDPPRAVRLLRALHRDPARAPRRRAAVLARAAAGRPRCRSPTATSTPPAQVADALHAAGLRAEVDDRTESVGRKIRDAELAKVPYMLVVGDREAEEGTVSRCAGTERATRARSPWPSSSSACRHGSRRATERRFEPAMGRKHQDYPGVRSPRTPLALLA